jgi:hypothetical protein
MTEKDKVELRQWSVGTASDMSRGATELTSIDAVIEAATKIYDWVINDKKK